MRRPIIAALGVGGSTRTNESSAGWCSGVVAAREWDDDAGVNG